MSDTAEKIPIVCPNCQKQYRVAASMAGKKASCRCGTVFAVEPPPSLPSEALPAATPEPMPPDPVLQEPASDEPLLRPPLDDVNSPDEPPPPPVVASPTDCVNHPGTPAVCACADCRQLLCRRCSYPQHDGRNLCTACALRSASPSMSGVKAYSAALIGPCAAHRDVQATARCGYCHALLCATCDFQFDKNLHLCGRCATTAPQGLGRCRKILLIGSLVALSLAVLGTIGKFALSAAIPPDNALLDDLLNRLVALPLLIPSIIGLAMACGSFARRAVNPPLIWVALSLNTLMVVFWFGMLLLVLFSPAPELPPPPAA